ncbi:hypothetical protein ACFQS7_28505 [Dankookia sp. GCM10030260]|uniref:hypothetical protein n=1 Tax=Dankookia sp. GCM10030260 TaxID=3273390 RepID=UPI00361765B8
MAPPADLHVKEMSWQRDTIRRVLDGGKIAVLPTPADMHRPIFLPASLRPVEPEAGPDRRMQPGSSRHACASAPGSPSTPERPRKTLPMPPERRDRRVILP